MAYGELLAEGNGSRKTVFRKRTKTKNGTSGLGKTRQEESVEKK